jgi:hypothetical protein
MNPVTSPTFPFDDEEGVTLYSPPTNPLTKNEQLGSVAVGVVFVLFLAMLLKLGGRK